MLSALQVDGIAYEAISQDARAGGPEGEYPGPPCELQGTATSTRINISPLSTSLLHDRSPACMSMALAGWGMRW